MVDDIGGDFSVGRHAADVPVALPDRQEDVVDEEHFGVDVNVGGRLGEFLLQRRDQVEQILCIPDGGRHAAALARDDDQALNRRQHGQQGRGQVGHVDCTLPKSQPKDIMYPRGNLTSIVLSNAAQVAWRAVNRIISSSGRLATKRPLA
ncbi:hypothetical protein Ae201684P_001622 [Aphanomyces euteiches]|nr:hypothetical protein Ae201684P_001622 [Aphanomyces euteiches]KAH9152336.1 hypothetical protein AeRB84_005219 [Aphanomyces euteiches]